MTVLTHDCVAKMFILFVKMGGGGQEVMILLFRRENFYNYGQPFKDQDGAQV